MCVCVCVWVCKTSTNLISGGVSLPYMYIFMSIYWFSFPFLQTVTLVWTWSGCARTHFFSPPRSRGRTYWAFTLPPRPPTRSRTPSPLCPPLTPASHPHPSLPSARTPMSSALSPSLTRMPTLSPANRRTFYLSLMSALLSRAPPATTTTPPHSHTPPRTATISPRPPSTRLPRPPAFTHLSRPPLKGSLWTQAMRTPLVPTSILLCPALHATSLRTQKQFEIYLL